MKPTSESWTELDDLVEHLTRSRATTLQVFELLADQDLAWRPGPSQFSLGQQLLHIAQAEDRLTQGVFNEDWSLERVRFPETLPDRRAMETYFQEVRSRLLAQLERLSPLDLARWIQVPNSPVPQTLRSLLWFMLEHELHHRGQFWGYLRALDKTPPFYAAPLPLGECPDVMAREALGGLGAPGASGPGGSGGPLSTALPDTPAELSHLGRIDIYVFDQLLRGRITPSMRVLDAGCGGGRNAEYLLRAGCEVHGVDANPEAIERARAMAVGMLSPGLAAERFQVGGLQDLPCPDEHFGAVICNAVLHFSRNEEDFAEIMAELWRVLAPGGVFFSRLASTIGIEDRVLPLEGRWYRLPDETERFLVNAEFLGGMAARLGAVQLDPLKTTVVEDMRAMTTWVLGKPDHGHASNQPSA